MKAMLRLPTKTFVLKNGLKVVVAPDHSSPTVAVSITYRVGSQDERPGRAGFAHLFEHLMAQGTRNLRPREISALIEGNGGSRNAYTMKTNTTYHSVVPTGALELVLWAEADRMHTLHVDERALALEKQVVLEEMRRSYLNQPYRRALTEGMGRAAFRRWENQHAAIGDAEDIRNAELADVRAFYDAHYAPNNAALALVGDVTEAEARRLMRKYFAAVPARALSAPPDLEEPPIDGDRRVDFQDPLAKLPRLMAAWHAPARGTRDFWALTALAEALSGGDESPLYRDLVKSARVAMATGAAIPWWTHHTNARGPDVFGFDVLLRAGAEPDAALRRLDRFLGRLARVGLGAEELALARTQLEFQWVNGLQFQLERARLLSSYAALIGDPAELGRDLAALLSIRPSDVKAAVRRWLRGRGRAVVRVRPVPPRPAEPEPATPPAPAESPRPAGERPPPVRKAKPLRPPRIERFRLGNGLSVLVAHEPRLPLVEARLSMPAGKLAETAGEEGLSEAAGSLFFKGASGRDAAAIARGFARLGVSVQIDDRRELAMLSAAGLSRSAEGLFLEVGRLLKGSSFPESEVRLWREQTLERLVQLRQDPEFLTGEAMKEELYGAHPYGRPFATDDQIRAVTGARLRRFHRRTFTPRGATLVLAGDLRAAAARRILERALGDWTPGPEPAAAPEPPAPKPARLRTIQREGSKQVNLSLAQSVAITPRDPAYPAFVVMNHILGGTSTARLFLNLRIDKGYTYGAYSRASTLSRCATWVANAETRAEVAAAALGEIEKEVRRIREAKVPAGAVAAAKRHLAGLYAIRLASLEGLAGTLWKLETDGLPPERELPEFLRRLDAVTPDEVQRAARAYLDPGRMVAIAVGDAADLARLDGAYRR